MLAAALRNANQNEEYENTLIVYTYAADEDVQFKEWIIALAESIGVWKNIYYCDHLLHYENQNVSWPIPVQKWRDELCSYCNIDHVNEIWIPQMHAFCERLLVEMFWDSKLVLYEEGLMTYGSCVLQERWVWWKHISLLDYIKWILLHKVKEMKQSFRLSMSCVPSEYYKKIDSCYLYLDKEIAVPDVIRKENLRHIKSESIKDALKTKIESIPVIGCGNLKYETLVLVLSQEFSRQQLLTRAEEKDMYLKLLKVLIRKGYAILWKDHPRSNHPFYDELKVALGDQIHLVEIPYYLPIELCTFCSSVKACVSISSSSLFYLKKLKTIPTYTDYQALDYLENQKNVHSSVSIARKYIPSLDHLPDMNKANHQ